MSPFWTSLSERLKDHGRDATLFLVVLAGFVVLALIAAISISRTDVGKVIAPALPLAAIFILTWAGFSIRRALINRRRRRQYPPLSDDELQKARSKLTRQRS